MSRALGVAWTCLLALMWVQGGSFLPSQLLWISGGGVLLAGAAVACLPGPLDRAEGWLLAGLGVAALGLLVVHGDPAAGLERLGWWGLAFAALVTARRAALPGWADLPLLAAALWVATGAVAEGVILGVPRAGGLFENPNVAAGILVPALAVLLTTAGPRFPRWTAAAFLLAGLAATGSRAGLLAAAVLSVVAAPPRLKRWWPVAVLLVAGIGVWRLATWPDALAWRRPAIWRAAATVVLHHPLWGASPGAFDEAVLPFRPEEPTVVARWSKRPGSAESTPLQAAAETGLPAAASLGWGFLLLAAAALRRGGPAGAMIPAVLVLAAFHDALGVPVLLWSWSWTVGRATGPPGTPAGHRRRPLAAAAAGVAAALLLARATLPPELALVRFHGDGPAAAAAAEPLLVLPWVARARRGLTLPAWNWTEASRALDAADRAVALHPADPTAWRLLGECAARTARELAMLPRISARAEEAFEHATRLDPHDPWAWLGWARQQRDLGRLERAQALARRAVDEEPNLVRGWLLLGRLALDRGEIDGARTALQHARHALRLGKGRLLSSYERELLAAPPWQLDQLQGALP